MRRLARNTLGRDFVVGDIHGAYDQVIAAMRAVKFNGKVDRLISVGDLVDRGAGSYRCLGFLRQPYVHAARGNHERDILELSYEEACMLAKLDFNGMSWIESFSREEFAEAQARFASLPLAIEIDTDRGLVGIVHGDVPVGMDWPTFTAALERGDPQVVKVALEGRDRIKGRNDAGVAGVGRVFVGHTVQWDGPRVLGNLVGIDSGACFWQSHQRGALTIVNVKAHTGSLHAPLEAAVGAGTMVFEQVSEGRFGAARPGHA